MEALLALGVLLIPFVWGVLFIYKPLRSQDRKGQAKKPESLEAQLFRFKDKLVDRERQLNAEAARLLQTEQALDRRELQLKYETAELSYKSKTLDAREHQINDLVRQRVAKTVSDLAHRPYLADTPTFAQICTDPNISRLVSALRENMKLSAPFQISTRIQSESGHEYTVTLSSCTCPDFSARHRPCKHMYRLAAEVGALLTYDCATIKEEILTLAQQKEGLELVLKDHIVRRRAYERQEEDFKRQKEDLEHQKERLDQREADIQHMVNSSQQNYPWLASLFSDYYDLILGKVEDNFRTKHPPAPRAADDVARLRADTKQLQKRLKLAEYQLAVYEALFPWLEEFKELSPADAAQAAAAVSTDSDAADEYAALRNWLSPEEYQTLSRAEKFQLALDRYQHRKNKTSWEVGIEYERYIGYLCEQRGYRVEYTGANLGLEDMGRDLIVSQGTTCFIIQCKRWAQEKTIHEKHIFQLFGSCVLYRLRHPDAAVSGVFVTTATLSDLARHCAATLEISLFEHIPLSDYPVIKCNVARDGEKIYHLPFDQQYDHVVIDPKRGEFFALTVAEAEAAGFRRALRHLPAPAGQPS